MLFLGYNFAEFFDKRLKFIVVLVNESEHCGTDNGDLSDAMLARRSRRGSNKHEHFIVVNLRSRRVLEEFFAELSTCLGKPLCDLLRFAWVFNQLSVLVKRHTAVSL